VTIITRSLFGFSPALGKTFDTEEVSMKTLFKLFLKTIIYLTFSSVYALLSEKTFNSYLLELD